MNVPGGFFVCLILVWFVVEVERCGEQGREEREGKERVRRKERKKKKKKSELFAFAAADRAFYDCSPATKSIVESERV